MIVIPNIVPVDGSATDHFGHVVRALDGFQAAHKRYPGTQAELEGVLADTLKDRSQYRRGNAEIHFQAKCLENASGPFLTDPGTEPGIMFYAVSPDQQEFWGTFTNLDLRGWTSGRVQFKEFFMPDESDRHVFHRSSRAEVKTR